MEKLKKIGIIGSIIYILVTAIAAVVVTTMFSYEDSSMFRVFIFFEILLTIFVVYLIKFFNISNIGFEAIRKRHLIWLIPHLLLIICMFTNVVLKKSYDVNFSQIVIIFIVSVLMGFSEELMFRGILFRSLCLRGNKFYAMFISSFLYALVGGAIVIGKGINTDLLVQIIVSFCFGFFASALRLKMKNIIPIIIIHSLWAFALNLFSLYKIEQTISNFGVLFSILFGTMLWINLLLKRDIFYKKKGELQ